MAGVVGITVITTVAVELTLRFDLHRPHLSLWRCGEAVIERLVGISSIDLPDRLDDFLGPSLLTVGIGLAVVAVLLATRPVVDRRRSGGRAAEARARDIVRRHGEGTLDYFALRSDKQWFFHRDSLVAYAIYGGVCLVSPDTIGPHAEREQVWGAFRRFADNRGWVVAIMGGSEDWLPVYRATGMHEIYIGDEAVVDIQKFSLAGGHMKGLRQAFNRIAKYGYTATFHDPARLDRLTAERITGLMSQSRRGEFERGFSMVLGRIFDPRDEGLVLCVVTGPDGEPAALCQFVPARGIGGFSLDLMRRDRGEHPNGLIDFALVSTIEHLRRPGPPWTQPQLRRPAFDPRRRTRRRGDPARRTLGPQEDVELPPDRDPVALQRQVRPPMAAALRRLRHRRAPRARRPRHPPRRVPVGGAGDRPHDRRLRPSRPCRRRCRTRWHGGLSAPRP